MSLPYSTLFINEQGLSGHVDYIVPAGFVAVVRSVTAYIDNSLFTTRFRLKDNDSGCTFVSFGVSTGVVESFLWDSRQVFHEGGTLRAETTGNPWDIRVSGYLLAL